MNGFTRGLDPKEAMGIGRAGILKEIGGIILNDKGEIERWKTEAHRDFVSLTLEDEEKELAENNLRKKNVVIGISDGQYYILRNRIKYTGPDKGDEEDLMTVLYELQDEFHKHGANFFHFPSMQKVVVKTIGLDLVAVKPISAPIGTTLYLDYQYKGNKSKTIGNGPI